jgi:hypothetical protein
MAAPFKSNGAAILALVSGFRGRLWIRRLPPSESINPVSRPDQPQHSFLINQHFQHSFLMSRHF